MFTTVCRVELITMFFSRLTQRVQDFRSLVKSLDRETAILVCQRLGYFVIFDPVSPTLSYRLRMWRPDEYYVAYRLYKIAQSAPCQTIKYFAVNGEEKKIPTDGPASAGADLCRCHTSCRGRGTCSHVLLIDCTAGVL